MIEFAAKFAFSLGYGFGLGVLLAVIGEQLDRLRRR